MAKHVSHLLAAYVQDELPLHLRRRVATHLLTCESCCLALDRERTLARTLKGEMPILGAPRPEQVTRLLPGILAEVIPPAGAERGFAACRFPGLGMVMLVSLALAILVPAMVLPRSIAVSAPDQPAPYQIAATPTLSMTDSPQRVLPVSPTVVAAQRDIATEPAMNPSPAPIVWLPPGQ